MLRHPALALAILGATACGARADVVLFDPFTDGDRTNGADAQDTAWYRHSTTAETATVSSAAGSAVISGDSALNISLTGTFQSIIGGFTAQTLGAAGSATSTLLLSFDTRITGSVGNSGSSFRFGLLNDGGNPYTADGTTGSETGFGGYLAELPTGTATGGSIVFDPSSGTSIIGGNAIGAGPTGSASSGVDATARSVSLSIMRTAAAQVTVVATLYAGPGLSGAALGSFTVTDTAATMFSYNAIAIGSNTTNAIAIDNVSVSIIPEPATLGLWSLGGLALLWRRNRRPLAV